MYTVSARLPDSDGDSLPDSHSNGHTVGDSHATALAQLFTFAPEQLGHVRRGPLMPASTLIRWAANHPQAWPYVADLQGRCIWVHPAHLTTIQGLAHTTAQALLPKPRQPRQRRAVKFPHTPT